MSVSQAFTLNDGGKSTEDALAGVGLLLRNAEWLRNAPQSRPTGSSFAQRQPRCGGQSEDTGRHWLPDHSIRFVFDIEVSAPANLSQLDRRVRV